MLLRVRVCVASWRVKAKTSIDFVSTGKAYINGHNNQLPVL